METAGAASSVHLVIPCYNERSRLPIAQLGELVADDRVSLVLVDDGSTDDTLGMLRSIERTLPKVTVVVLPSNVGKGEAVRAGMLTAMAANPSWLGYVDADMATPAGEILRLLDLAMGTGRFDVVLGSRLALLGRQVQRSRFRHYTGRVFATLASNALEMAVYDTQCGAKIFRRTEALELAIAAPFRSRWAFDVELLGRLGVGGAQRFWEEPLLVWRDVERSKRTVASSIRASVDLVRIRGDLRRARS